MDGFVIFSLDLGLAGEARILQQIECAAHTFYITARDFGKKDRAKMCEYQL